MLPRLVSVLKNGGIAVIPTDTIYGIVCRADLIKSVHQLYKIRGRSVQKPSIVLTDSIDRLTQFGINLTAEQRIFCEHVWPGEVSIIFDVEDDSKWKHVTGGSKKVSVRLPNNGELRALLSKVGPLIAPSANVEGQKPSETIEEARINFGDAVNFYQDGGYKTGEPSTVVYLHNDGTCDVIRQGIVIL